MSKRPFMDTLREIEMGGLLDELTDAQHNLIDLIRLTNKAGALTITLNYKPEGAGQITVKAEVKAKEPKLPRGSSLFFLTPEGNLSRRDPRQQQMDLRPVGNEEPPGELRKVAE